jgi:hypothetical protein
LRAPALGHQRHFLMRHQSAWQVARDNQRYKKHAWAVVHAKNKPRAKSNAKSSAHTSIDGNHAQASTSAPPAA